MGDQNPFGSPFSSQPGSFPNSSQNVTAGQDLNQAAPSIFSSSSTNPGFGLFANNAEASGAVQQDTAFPPAPTNLFSNPGPKSLFGPSAESSTSIFGGSAFSKPSESVFSSTVRPSMFGGNATVNSTQSSDDPKIDAGGASIFGRTQASSNVKATELVSSASGSIFGGSFPSAQSSIFKPNPSNNLSSQTVESTSGMKPSIFGGAYSRKEEPSTKAGFLMAATDSDKPKVNFFASDSSKVSFDGLASSASEKPNLFSSSKSAFDKVSNAGIVTSTLSNRSQERTSNPFLSEERKDEDQVSAWEPDSLEGLNQDPVSDEPKKTLRVNKLVREKRGVFGKALDEVARSSRQPEDRRSIMCHPLDGKLGPISALKDHFQQFGQPRVSVNKEKNYCVATYKTHQEFEKAMKASRVINGMEYQFFARNMAKTRRKSLDEEEKQKSTEERKVIPRRTHMDMDDDVREELAAISGIDYLMPQDASSKRKAVLDREVRKKSRSLGKPEGVDSDGKEVQDELYEPLKRNINRASRTDGAKDVKSRAPKMDEKPSLLSRLGSSDRPLKKLKDDSVETKPEKSEPKTSAITSAITTELRTALKQQATTSEEKLRLLDIRDKLIRHLQPKQYDISKAVKTVGTCPDMCPEKERLLRETRRQISQYEMSSTKASEMDPKLMVKQYSRSSADQEEPLPHDLRPPAVLTMTMNYLMHTIMNQGDEPGENLGEWYHFLWDRLRGIRKEITQQELSDIDAVSLVEQCARFHIHCGARLVAEDMSVFDDRINTENLTKCLQTLKHMYCDLWMNNSITCPNEPEFISYFLLLNLNNGTIMWEMEQLREEVLKSPEIGFVASMYNSLSSNNYIRFFRLVRKASYLNSCLCIRYFHQVRAKALKTYIKALAKIRPVNYPLGSLVEELGFENAEHAAAFCSHYGLHVDNASSDSACVNLNNETFEIPTFALPTEREFRLAESKKMSTVGEVVFGGPLPPRSYENHTVHESFDENGYLLKSELQLRDQEREEEEVVTEVMDSQHTQAVNSSANDDIGFNSDKTVSQTSATALGGFGNSKLVFSTPFTNTQSAPPKVFNVTSNQIFKPSMNFLQVPSEKQTPAMQEAGRLAALQELQAERARAQMEAEKKAQAAELEKYINSHSEVQLQDLLESSVKEVATEIALGEWKAAEQQQLAEEKQRAMAQLQAQEELRKRILDTTIDRISNDSLADLFNEVVAQMVAESAQEGLSSEMDLVASINVLSKEYLESLIYDVTDELCYDVATEEKRKANECARKEAVKHRVRQIFYFWLERARRSLHRRRVMQDFPASVIPLSIKEHAQRWSICKSDEADAWESCSKGNDKVLDIPELKAMPAYPQITFAELIAIQAVHRYDTIRVKLGLHPTDKLLYKLFVSVPEEPKDPAGQLVDWWIRRTLKQTGGMVCDDVEKGLYRIVSGVKVTSEVAVYASLQMVRGNNLLEKQTSLASGTSAVLFGLSPSSNIEESRSRLTTLLKSIHKLPAVPLVIAVVSPVEPPLEGLKQLVALLELDQWLHHGAISDYQILHVEELFDLKYLSQRFNMSFNYMVMTWTPTPEFALVCLKNVLRSTFQMFFISIQFNYNSSEIYPRDIDDPRVIIGLCNEWLDHMCQEFVTAHHEAKDLCGEEFWPLLHKGAYLPFLNKPKYELLLREVIQNVSLPPLEWPPSSEEEFESILSRYCSWLKPSDQKQTLRRLSCLNGLEWSEKIGNIPWVNLIEDWMEARINYIETSAICGTELLCLMRTQNVEHLYTYPWWAQSQYLLSYIEANGLGRECEMDVDQTVPFECASPEGSSLSPVEPIQESSGLQNLNEVTECVSELKKVNESLLSRLCTALEDGPNAATASKGNHSNASVKPSEVKAQATASDLESLVKNVDLQVKAHRNLRSSLNNMLSKALAEEDGDASKEAASAPLNIIQNSVAAESTKIKASNEIVTSDPGEAKSPQKMDQIMSSVNDIMSSLNQKYKIFDDVSASSKISDLKLGLAKVDDCSAPLSENLHHSTYVKESQERMMERLHGSSSKKTSKPQEKYQESVADSDLEVMSDERSLSSSYGDSETEKSVSDPEAIESDGHSSDSEYEQNARSKKRLHSHDSDNDSYSESRPRRHRNESDNDDYSRDKSWDGRRNRDRDQSSQDDGGHEDDSEDDSEDDNSERYSRSSEHEPSDDEEIQTITSDDSRESTSYHQSENLPEASASHCDDGPLIDDGIQPVSGSYLVEAESIVNNGLVIEDNSESHLTNLDNPHHQYQSYYVEGTDIGVVEDSVFTVSAEMAALNPVASSVVVSNSDIVSEGNDELLVGQYEPSSGLYEMESNRSREYESSEFVPDHSEGTHHNISDENDHYELNSRRSKVSEGSSRNIDEDSGSEVEDYENVEEEEYDDGEAEPEGEEECMEEEEMAEEEVEEESETEPETEAEPEEDSDVCEVIDDD